MLSLSKPSNQKCTAVLDSLRSAELNYNEVGCLNDETPAGFNRDKSRCIIGTGRSAWTFAMESFKQWKFMPESMVEIKNAGPIELGRVVGVVFRALGVWSLNPARIIELHDSAENGVSEFGFTYGTLRGHVERGEEKFLLTWNHATDEVAFEIEAVSRPNHFLAWMVYPYSRMMQAKFRSESSASMRKSVRAKAKVAASSFKEVEAV